LICSIHNKNLSFREVFIKYYIIHTLGGIILITGFLMSQIIISPTQGGWLIIFISIILKLGVAPFHFWFPPVINHLSWLKCSLIITWQKVAPLTIIVFIRSIPIPMFIVVTSLWGALFRVKVISVRLILTMSSISHLGWILAGFILDLLLIRIYFIIYTVLLLLIFIFLSLFNSHDSSFVIRGLNPFYFIMILSSLGGLPPLLGFLPKWLIIKIIASFSFFILTLILTITAVLLLFVYLSIFFNINIINKDIKKKSINSGLFSLIFCVNLSFFLFLH